MKSASCRCPGGDFAVTGESGEVLARLDGATGDFLLRGQLFEEDAAFDPQETHCFDVRHGASDATVFAYIDAAGNLHLRGRAFIGADPDRQRAPEEVVFFEDFEDADASWDLSWTGASNWTNQAHLEYVGGMTTGQVTDWPPETGPVGVGAKGAAHVYVQPKSGDTYPFECLVTHEKLLVAPDGGGAWLMGGAGHGSTEGAEEWLTIAPDGNRGVFSGSGALTTGEKDTLDGGKSYVWLRRTKTGQGLVLKIRGQLNGPNHFLEPLSTAVCPTIERSASVGDAHCMLAFRYQIPAEAEVNSTSPTCDGVNRVSLGGIEIYLGPESPSSNAPMLAALFAPYSRIENSVPVLRTDIRLYEKTAILTGTDQLGCDQVDWYSFNRTDVLGNQLKMEDDEITHSWFQVLMLLEPESGATRVKLYLQKTFSNELYPYRGERLEYITTDAIDVQRVVFRANSEDSPPRVNDVSLVKLP